MKEVKEKLLFGEQEKIKILQDLLRQRDEYQMTEMNGQVILLFHFQHPVCHQILCGVAIVCSFQTMWSLLYLYLFVSYLINFCVFILFSIFSTHWKQLV